MSKSNFPLAELFAGGAVKQDDRSFTKPIMHVHEYYLSGELDSPEHYIQWFDTIRHANSNDMVKIYINSPGGDVFTAIQFVSVLRETQAHVVVSVEGLCISAATMIMLEADTYEIANHSMLMIHNYSGGSTGKGAEMFDQLVHERGWSDALFRDIYEGFLTDEEITQVLDNKDLWMDGKEAIRRLKQRGALHESNADATDEDDLDS